MELIDNKGTKYPSLGAFSRETGIPRSTVGDHIRGDGFYENKDKGIRVEVFVEQVGDEPKMTRSESIIWDRLKDRYTEDELRLISKGNGLQDPNSRFPKIRLSGKHHKIGVISDGHLGSKFSPLEFHYEAFKKFEDEECECILHCGDVVEGLCPKRINTQIYELTHIGFKQQHDLAVEVFSHCNLPVYCISGNHDGWYQDLGGNIVESICNDVPNMTYLGHDQADINVDGAIIRLFHGGDGNSYALSYRLQKIAESYTSGKKPNILLAGHVHKQCYIFDRMIHCCSVPCLQMQTDWMRGKKLAAHTGFDIIEFDVDNGSVTNFTLRFFPFYA